MADVTTFGIVGSGWRAEFFLRLAAMAPDRLRVSGVVTRREQRGGEVTARYGRAGVPDGARAGGRRGARVRHRLRPVGGHPGRDARAGRAGGARAGRDAARAGSAGAAARCGRTSAPAAWCRWPSSTC